jgi:hypothetical protein
MCTNDPTSVKPVVGPSSSLVIFDATRQSMLSSLGRENKCVWVTSTTALILAVQLLREAFQGGITINAT